ncbi:Palmitoyltransferase [Plasmodium coatneyi]|uniref:Palmitoyltransferase n=1 Tax=Plasmodium coatneyi TaxID=208452 RepID=A0A1B1E4I5_9APIC|nr:Palmitoyltransferase [Plasmodium coatneyi]ANQ09942.1 Palmitoyltransferase [Plasmodium coatneyi]
MRIPECVPSELPSGVDILFELAKRRDERVYNLLEQDERLLNCRDGNGNSLLHWSVFLNDAYLTCYLLQKGADVNAKAHNAQTPLFWAVSGSNLHMIHLLRKHGGDIFHTDDKGYSCLTISTQYGHVLCFLYLIHLGASLTHRDLNSCSILDWAAYNNNIFFLRLLSKVSPNLFSIDLKNPASTLHKAIIGNAYDAVVFLVLHGHQNVHDISTEEEKTVTQFVEEHKDKVDRSIYNFVTCRKVQQLCRRRGGKEDPTLYEPSGTIGPYVISRRKKLSTLCKIRHAFTQDKTLLLYPATIILSHLYNSCIHFFYTRGAFLGKSPLWDVAHPMLFILYYMVVSSDPGYLEEEGNPACDIKADKKDPLHPTDVNPNNSTNLTFRKIIKNVKEEIKLYEEKNKLTSFCEMVKWKNISEVKNSLQIKLDAQGFEVTSFDVKKLCPTCFLFKNLRTKHCRFCGRCVDIYDHHCLFTLNCMSVDNAKVFLIWIVSNLLFHFWKIYIHILCVFMRLDFLSSSLVFRGVSLSVVLISLLHLYFMGVIFLRSVLNILENITSNEKFKMYSSNTFFLYELKKDKNNEPVVVRKFKNPFDKGALFNFIHFFTKSKDHLSNPERQFIRVDDSVQSASVRAFVDKLNGELRRVYAKR